MTLGSAGAKVLGFQPVAGPEAHDRSPTVAAPFGRAKPLYAAASAAPPKRTATRRETPGSCMVTP
jgi:hypothetical protein